MSNNLYMAFHPGDYLTDTAHLSTLEHGAYLLLIMNYWQRGEPLPLDDKKLRGITRMSASEWAESRVTLLEFFVEREGALHHKRIDEELERARTKSSRARASAELSHSARKANAKQSQAVRVANQDQDQDQVQEKEEAIASSSTDDEIASLPEMMRRLEQATGWLDLPGEKTIEQLVADGFSFDARILPLARDEAARRSDKPRSWAYLATVVRDQTRKPTPAVTPVEMAWVPVGSPTWKALTSKKREGYLRTMLKPGPGGEGIHWPVSDLPPASGAAA